MTWEAEDAEDKEDAENAINYMTWLIYNMIREGKEETGGYISLYILRIAC